MIKIALLNQKGGVAKTTSAVNISDCLVEQGNRVLAIDLDPQANLSYNFGLDTDTLDTTIYDVFTKDIDITDAIYTVEAGVDVLAANLTFANAELEISSRMNRESILKNAFKKLDRTYDYCILDLPPNLGLLTLNGLAFADYVLVPLDVGVFSLSGLKQLMSVVQLIKENDLNSKLDIAGVFLTKVDDRTNLSREIYETLGGIFGDKMFKTYIHQNIKIAESQKEQKPITRYDSSNRGSKEYRELTKEMISRVNG